MEVDERDEEFKGKGGHRLKDGPFWGGTITPGDLSYDVSLFKVFEKMFIKRFGSSSSNGYKTEIKLNAFYCSVKANDLTGVPFLGIAVVGMDNEWHGILKNEVSLLDKEDKYIFHKIYDIDIKEMRSPKNSSGLDFDMYIKAFNKFAEEFETDINRIKF